MIEAFDAIVFTNEVVRPIAEKLRGFNVEIDAALVDWFSGMNVTISNTSDVIEDGRGDQGVSRLTGQDVHNLMAVLVGLQTEMDGKDQTVSKPTVRPLRIQ
jgi:hypothetical protein